jgi:hypothetical protein
MTQTRNGLGNNGDLQMYFSIAFGESSLDL